MKFKLSFFGILTVAICQCSCSLSENQNQKISHIKDEEFDILLSNQNCRNQFVFNDGAFYYPYDGCEYNPPQQNIGNASVFLLPKEKHKVDYSSEEIIVREEASINSMTPKELKENNTVVVFLVSQKFLKEVKDGESLFAPAYPYEEECFVYDDKTEAWQLQESFIIRNLEDEQIMTQKMWAYIEKLKK
jgi:hypothetical protein